MNAIVNRNISFIDLGLIDYQKAWDYQTELFNQSLAIKSANRSLTGDQQKPTPNHLIFCEHPHVYTLGKSGDDKNLIINEDHLSSIGASFYRINRGGDITYHGPGQVVVYPVIDLENFFTDIHQYMRFLEESVIQTLATLGITAGRIRGLTGVWVDADQPAKARKICAMGVKTSRWVTMHGLALNVNVDLNYFHHIVPCGISDKAVTSVEKELGAAQDVEKIKVTLKSVLMNQFQMEEVA